MFWVVGDVHGCYDEFMELVNKVKSKDSFAKFVLVGDIVDRGPKTWEMLQWATKTIDNSNYNSEFKMVIGNHEHDKIDWWSRYKANGFFPEKYKFHLYVGQYGIEAIDSVVEWFKTLPYILQFKVNDRLFVVAHAAVPEDIYNRLGSTGFELDKYEKERIVWDRVKCPYETDGLVFVGHTPTVLYHEVGWYVKQPGKVDKCENWINVDCGLVYDSFEGHNLAAVCVETLEEVYLWEV